MDEDLEGVRPAAGRGESRTLEPLGTLDVLLEGEVAGRPHLRQDQQVDIAQGTLGENRAVDASESFFDRFAVRAGELEERYLHAPTIT
ncbi:hypothetical protein GCM10010197_47320 [Nocardioides luteus]|uniref:Uncharacterized protein n=1 Tax=Nocardioides luteus TaxID=1844 RepID=A0ABQ5T3Y8_9ACTN|nr:hypothetical protein GCM10010197_47320 [Nocardioides luteus]GLJ70538.1 hypothetical protein GCM10017579_45740 [Nocardioides luteus]